MDDWIVVFGGVGDGGGGLGSSNNGFGVPPGQRRRRRKVEDERKVEEGREVEEEEGGEGESAGVLGGSIMEDGRLTVLGKEREVLGRLLGPAVGGMRRK